MVRMSRVVRLSVTKRLASGTHTRRFWMLRFCQRLVLMLECETFCALNLRLPVMSLFAMPLLARRDPRILARRKKREGEGIPSLCQASPDLPRFFGPSVLVGAASDSGRRSLRLASDSGRRSLRLAPHSG